MECLEKKLNNSNIKDLKCNAIPPPIKRQLAFQKQIIDAKNIISISKFLEKQIKKQHQN